MIISSSLEDYCTMISTPATKVWKSVLEQKLDAFANDAHVDQPYFLLQKEYSNDYTIFKRIKRGCT